MICDDEHDVLATYAAILRENITTSSGKECIDVYTRRKNNGHRIHLILLDFKLGDMTGEQVARSIMILNGTRIILISAYQLESDLIENLKENKVIVEFLSKPIDMQSLRGTVNKFITIT